ncbi:MlaE family lipid ABC transporter permease subunit [Sulfurimonas sp. HSL1-2]|uniref:ABC transporter permease n=1 Tax=Thiomicrolovo zhangzhouensis TaxID=3131933 RepID=UPI0031F9DF01
MAQLRIEETGRGMTVYCSGLWQATALDEVAGTVRESLAPLRSYEITFELSGVERIDSAGALLLQHTQRRLEAGGNLVKIQGADDDSARMLEMVRQYSHPGTDFAVASPGFLAQTGRQTAEVLANGMGITAFVGRTFKALVNLLFLRVGFRYKETGYQMMESAIKALGIIALTMFLVGVVVAYQSAVQLKTYGANIFIVDALGISILRELAPMLTAIVVAGRSGSSYAAQIGVMKMTEEIDAMRTMGFDPFAFLVLPRLFALIIMMPILIFFADAFGMLGGMLIAHTELGLSVTLFTDRFTEAVALKHFWVGLVKGPFFAVLIASIGIYRGMQVKNDTESIGINTTKSVVEAIFAVIICDALFSIVFTKLGF